MLLNRCFRDRHITPPLDTPAATSDFFISKKCTNFVTVRIGLCEEIDIHKMRSWSRVCGMGKVGPTCQNKCSTSPLGFFILC